MSKFALEIKNLSYSYDRNVEVLNKLNFQIKKSTFVSIIGHNGSGKSTLAKLIAGILDLPKSAELFIFDEKLTAQNSDELRKNIGIVFQNPDNQFIGQTVQDDIAFGLESRNVAQKDMDAIINEFAAKVGMLEFLQKEPMNLSGGQKQRVAIAGVLAMHPKILLLDEATAMLDPKGKREIKEIILKLKEEISDLTIISVTHDLEDALASDEIIVMNEGQIVLQGKPEYIFSHHETLTNIKLDLPFIFKMKLALKKQGINLESNNVEDLVNESWP